MESVAITALLVAGVLVLGRWAVIEITGWRHSRDNSQAIILNTIREEWREALPIILAELDFSFKPVLSIEVKQGVSTGVESVSETLETLPMNIQKYIALDSADFAREDLVKRAFVYRDGGKREWEEVLGLLKESIDSAW